VVNPPGFRALGRRVPVLEEVTGMFLLQNWVMRV